MNASSEIISTQCEVVHFFECISMVKKKKLKKKLGKFIHNRNLHSRK